MELHRNAEGGYVTLTVVGDLDVRSASELREAGGRELEDEACRRLILDLSRVEFIDSTGLGALLGIRLAAEKQGKQVVLRSPSEHVFYVLDLAGLGEDFTVEGL